MTRSLESIAQLAGPLLVLGFLAGAAWSWWRADPDRLPRVVDRVAEAALTMAVATLAWAAIEAVSPGGRGSISRVALADIQALTAWQSVSLWTGLACVTGLVASPFRRFEGSDGLLPTAALLAAHFPYVFAGTAIAFSAGWLLKGSERAAQVAAIGMLLPVAWLGWIIEWQPAWGMAVGPEAALWATVATGVLATRWWHDRPMEGLI